MEGLVPGFADVAQARACRGTRSGWLINCQRAWNNGVEAGRSGLCKGRCPGLSRRPVGQGPRRIQEEVRNFVLKFVQGQRRSLSGRQTGMIALHNAKRAVIQPGVVGRLLLTWLDHNDGRQAFAVHTHLGRRRGCVVGQSMACQPSGYGRGERTQQDDHGSHPDHPAKMGAGAGIHVRQCKAGLRRVEMPRLREVNGCDRGCYLDWAAFNAVADNPARCLASSMAERI